MSNILNTHTKTSVNYRFTTLQCYHTYPGRSMKLECAY